MHRQITPTISRLSVVIVCFLVVASTATPPPTGLSAGPLYEAGAPRIVAIGDLHGDLDAARRALRLAGAIDESDRWIGDDLVIVQTGDILDRGDDEQAILDLFDRIEPEAVEAGGRVYVLNGNHELMNAELDLRYVTAGGYEDFQDAVSVDPDDPELAAYDDSLRARVMAFRPGGVYARQLSRYNVVLILGGNVFVHGGILPKHVDYGLERLNAEVSMWLNGDGEHPPLLEERESPVWARRYSRDVDDDDCETLADVLESLSAERMIVGHTVQSNGVTTYCNDRVWCIDVGMSTYYGGDIAVLEITDDGLRVLTEAVTPVDSSE